ncbi:hypothetical protein EWM63_09430 [Pseudoduganella lutea]|uniref:Uncharacterized protein n=2 Tax=Pseudoduganella lutea TaxID=321985 RepID=A0A4V0Z4J7_9BURK|nr:hypothetical protein EWM63_09430 [Pseudoduganella lutea]
MTALPAVDTQFPGAGCLLCMAAASVANSSLTSYTKTLQTEDLGKVHLEVAEALRKKGASVKMIDNIDFSKLPDNNNTKPNFARKDFTGLKAQYNVDKLMVISVTMVGIERSYASYVPTSDPKARVAGVSYIVNLNDNSLEWYLPLDVSKASDGKWDEPPKFPGLTNAYFQSLELAKDRIVKPLAQ